MFDGFVIRNCVEYANKVYKEDNILKNEEYVLLLEQISKEKILLVERIYKLNSYDQDDGDSMKTFQDLQFDIFMILDKFGVRKSLDYPID